MPLLKKPWTPPLLALATLALAGCETLTSAPTKLDATAATALYRPIAASRRDTCETQRQVAEHNSRHETLTKGAPVAFKAACDLDQKGGAAKGARTS